MNHEDLTLERDRELDRITATLDSAAAGEGRVLVVEGTAGIGKTRLVRECRDLAKARGFGRLQAVGDALEAAMAWGVIRQLVERSVSRYSGGTRAAILAGPSGAALDALDAAAADPSEAELARALHALWWVAVDLSSTRPLLITVDDAQWADVPSLRFLDYLSRRIADLPIALVVATRPLEANSGPLAQMSVSRQAERIHPRPLTRDALAEFAAARGPAPAAEVAAALHEASGGNPFLATVLLDEVDALGLDPDHPATGARIAGLGPSTVFRAALGRLPDPAIRLARAAAVLGQGIDPWLTGSVADLDPADLPAAVAALVAGHVLADDGDHLVFQHPVVREAVLAELGPLARAALHARAAIALTAANAPADRVAAHLVNAPRGTLPDAADVLRSAAAALLAAGDAATAATHLARAVDECPQDPAVRAEWGRALLRTGAAVEARVQLRAAAAGLPDAELIAAAASATVLIDGPEAAADELTAAIAARPAGAREAGRMHLQARLAVIRSFVPGLRQASSAHLAGYADLPGETPDERTLLGLVAQTGRYEVWPADQVAAIARRALSDGAYLDDAAGSTDAMVAWVVAMLALIMADDVNTAGREVARAQQRVRAHGSPVEFAMVANVSVLLNWRQGNVGSTEAEAESTLAAAANEDPSPTVTALRATATQFAAYSAIERGDLDGAASVLARFDAEHADAPRIIPTIWLHEARATLALAAGDAELARRMAYQQRDELASAGFDPSSVSWRVPAIRALMLLGEPAEALRLAEELVAIARRWGAPTEVGIALRLCAHADPEQRLDLLTESVEVLRGAPSRLELARTLVDLGEVLRVSRRRTEAREPLNQAADLAAVCGSPVLRARAVTVLEALGDRPRRPVFGGLDALTASERRVADLAVTGRGNREIAQELFVSPKTVENHLGRIYTKLGIAGRRDLVRVLV
ncbi:putative regulatory protein [Alloactinosynnema sp. L-07]|uniref:helix-turn-helix transcriptional regulator n=1 Tax=Alloactinosynnema sp. L-07 TaxID=1653480 RepID=UPI00065F0393|nr:LuxR family transcriptional regulator [Alloactinosynnema sp. L-07]CRK59807.1 putative regulatory protein [Alloactinosynnema sp. L-07]